MCRHGQTRRLRRQPLCHSLAGCSVARSAGRARWTERFFGQSGILTFRLLSLPESNGRRNPPGRAYCKCQDTRQYSFERISQHSYWRSQGTGSYRFIRWEVRWPCTRYPIRFFHRILWRYARSRYRKHRNDKDRIRKFRCSRCPPYRSLYRSPCRRNARYVPGYHARFESALQQRSRLVRRNPQIHRGKCRFEETGGRLYERERSATERETFTEHSGNKRCESNQILCSHDTCRCSQEYRFPTARGNYRKPLLRCRNSIWRETDVDSNAERQFGGRWPESR